MSIFPKGAFHRLGRSPKSKKISDVFLSEKLASSRGQCSPIIALHKPNSLSLLNAQRDDAEGTRSGEDHVTESRPNADDVETISIADATTYNNNYFASCEALLNSASSSSFRTKPSFPSSKSVSNIRGSLVEEKGCLTDVHCGAREEATEYYHHPEDEVEIVSLLEEQIPRYKLRADSLTKFGGCANADFIGIPYPVLEDYTPVTPEQAYLTFGYFLLSGERVSQMTKTYSDVDAVQRLLEEKEKDLELAARIGQQLLQQNRLLEEKLESVEADYKESQETATQLKHELLFKTQLLELYDNGPSEENSKATTPVASVASLLERRVALLEDENNSLRTEACRIVETVEKCEAEEKYLVHDAIRQLGEANSKMKGLSDELQKKTDETISQQDEIQSLVEEIKTLQGINKEIFVDNVELQKTVETLKTAQNELSAELVDLKENYLEIVAILKETQEQLREAQKQKESGMDVISVFDSLAYEIENSVARQRRSSDYFRRCFDMVKSVNHKFPDMSGRSMMSSGASSGYHSGFSEQPSLDSSGGSQDMMVLVNPVTISITGSELSTTLSLCGSPGSCSTPDKLGWRMPEKLQIIKPIEGSSTLQIWSSLATPHLGNLLETRPGVHMRVERSLGCNTAILALTGPDQIGLNFTSTAPVFTFVTTSSSWNSRRDSTTTVYTNDMSSNFSTYSLSSRSSSPIPSSHLSGSGDSLSCKLYELDDCKEYELRCETPHNSPTEGNSRPSSPSNSKPNEIRSFRSLYGTMYDSIVAKLGGKGSRQSSCQSEITNTKSNLETSSKIEPVKNINNRQQAPAKPGTGVLERILSDSSPSS